MTKLDRIRLLRLSEVTLETVNKNIVDLKLRAKEYVHKLASLRNLEVEIERLKETDFCKYCFESYVWSRAKTNCKESLRYCRERLKSLQADRRLLIQKLKEESKMQRTIDQSGQSFQQQNTLILCT